MIGYSGIFVLKLGKINFEICDFWDITQGIIVVYYRHFVTPCRFHLQGSSSLSSQTYIVTPTPFTGCFYNCSSILPIWWRHNTSYGWSFTPSPGQLISPVGQSLPHISGLDRVGYPPNSTTYTVTLTPFNECFDYGLRCLRQGYQSDGCTGKIIVSYFGVG